MYLEVLQLFVLSEIRLYANLRRHYFKQTRPLLGRPEQPLLQLPMHRSVHNEQQQKEKK